MERIVTADEMKWCDRTTIEDIGIPGLVLMENAGTAVVRFVRETLGDLAGKHIAVFCGKGNNGGDGFVVARRLAGAGSRVSVILTAPPAELKGDALANFSVLKKIANRVLPAISIQRYSRNALEQLGHADGIVDAIFGTGFSGKVRQPLVDLINWINGQSVPVFAIDVPSGINATNGVVENAAIRATETITFGLCKTGLLLNNGQANAGTVRVADIGIPRVVTESKTLSPTYLVHQGDVRDILPQRPKTAHKYSVGKVLVIAGSRGYTGAAALCATAALRSGAGAVMLGTPEAVYPILARKLSEVIVIPLPSTDYGTLSLKSYGMLKPRIEWADVIAMGPGLSQSPETQSLVIELLNEIKGRIVLDADGLNAVAGAGAALLKKLKSDVILTPHSGEFARLARKPSQEVDQNRIDLPRLFARQSGVTVVLKGAPTVTATSDGFVYVNSTGNPGMATVGSGDVLTGIISGLWAQGTSPGGAAFGGVYLHGLAGDIAKQEFGERSLIAGDMIDCLPRAFSSVERGESC
jgi:NAD(P)H-hydrate epimerase